MRSLLNFLNGAKIRKFPEQLGKKISRCTCYVVVFFPDSKVYGANMGPTWALSAPDGPHEHCYLGYVSKWSIHYEE